MAVGALALIVFWLAETGAPTVRAGISRSRWALALHFCTALFATVAFYALWTRKYRLARACAAAQVTLILLGWALAQFPHLVEPDITITSAAAPRVTLQLLLGALAVGAILLFPSYYYLFRIFKSETAFAGPARKDDEPKRDRGREHSSKKRFHTRPGRLLSEVVSGLQFRRRTAPSLLSRSYSDSHPIP